MDSIHTDSAEDDATTEGQATTEEAETAEAPAAPARPAARRITVTNFIDPGQLRADLTYSLANLSDAMQGQAALYVHYAMLAAKASKQVDDVEMLLEVAESRVDRELRDRAATLGNKVTEAQLEKQVRLHPQVISTRRALNAARQVEAIGKAAAQGFIQRKDMLVQHGAKERKEMEGEVRTMSRASR